MTLPKVFVASSSEGLPVVDVIRTLLQKTLRGMADVSPWPGEFQLSKAYIESLESLLDTSDFAVMVLTPDDRTKSREAERWSPRDNVVFELGLFIGRLGRERCFLIQRSDLDLKLPSDLLGIETASYSLMKQEDLKQKELKAALKPVCSRIGEAIRVRSTALPSRPKLSDVERAAQAAMRRFADRIAGGWWERIRLKGQAQALSFVTIELDDAHNSVRLEGKAYGHDGTHVANWRSAAARIDGNKILYVRECQRLDYENLVWLPGLGEVDFVNSTHVIEQGHGKFWESDESRPEDTVIKSVELRRNPSNSHECSMRKGSDIERRDLVKEILLSW